MKEEGRTMAELGERYGFISTESFSKVLFDVKLVFLGH
jgi:hypothetical protein